MKAAIVIVCQGILVLLLSPTGSLAEFTIGDPEPEYCEEESPDGEGGGGGGGGSGTAPLKPIKIVGDYPKEGKGTESEYTYKNVDWEYYENPPNPNAKRALIAVHDTGGFQGNGNVRQVVDVLSDAFNFRIMMPDFGTQDIFDWRKVKPGLEAAIAHIKTDWGIHQIGMFGWCAGGKDTYEAAKELAADLKAAVLLHPYDITDSRGAKDVKIPMYLILSNGEKSDMKVFEDIEKTFKDNKLATGLMWFNEPHGFAGNNVVFSKSPSSVMATEKAINITGRFFAAHM